MSAQCFVVVTTIHPKSEAIAAFEARPGWHTLVVGDRKTPTIASSERLTFLPFDEQINLGFRLAGMLPADHYARKNLGYLLAMARGAHVIYETDDDNIPYPEWRLPDFVCATRTATSARFVNVYRYFTTAAIWPRGFPLDEILTVPEPGLATAPDSPAPIGVWQGLVNDEPDLDAICRAIVNRKITFRPDRPFFLPPGSYAPLNSQNTFWHRETFLYLYLPSTVNSRFTDILRGYLAQRLMWQHNLHAGFLAPAVYQRRNAHDLLDDLRSEWPACSQIKAIVERLERLPFTREAPHNLRLAYAELHCLGVVGAEELSRLGAWIDDCQRLTSESP